jgi:WD40 repeat protein
MSYSHALDGNLAPRLQESVEQYGRTWYRRRAVRVFRDSANLSATSHLWGSIEQALADSEWFILLASPEAARSFWVRREVAWWLANRSADRMLIGITSGSAAWDIETGLVSADRTDALPPEIGDHGLPEPLLVDFRDLRTTEPSDPAFLSATVEIAATLRGVPKDDLIGEHVRQHRRRRLTLVMTGISLVVLTLLSAMTAGLALQQRDRADQQAALAEVRQLVSVADGNTDTRVDLARLLAAHAYKVQPDDRTYAALLRAVTASPQFRRFIAVSSLITSLNTSADGDSFIVGTDDGQVEVFDDRGDRLFHAVGAPSPVLLTAVDDSASHVVAGNRNELKVWDVSNSERLPRSVPEGGANAAAAISSDGTRLAVANFAEADGTTAVLGGVAVVQISDLGLVGRARLNLGVYERPVSGEDTGIHMRFADDLSLTVGVGPCDEVEADPSATSVIPRRETCSLPANGLITSSASSGSAGGYFIGGEITVFANDDPEGSLFARSPVEEADLMTVDPDLTRVAVSQSGVIHVSPLSRSQGTPAESTELRGASGVRRVEFLRGDLIVSAGDGGLQIWDTGTAGPLVHDTGIALPDSIGFVDAPVLKLSPDSTMVAVVDEDGAVTVLDVRGGAVKASYSAAELSLPYGLAWSIDAADLTVVGGDGEARTWRLADRSADPIEDLPVLAVNSAITQLSDAQRDEHGTLYLTGFYGDVVARRSGSDAEVVVPPVPGRDSYTLPKLSPAGRYAARAVATTVEVRELSTGRLIRIDMNTQPRELAFSGEQHVVVVGSDSSTKVIDLSDGAVRDFTSIDPSNLDGMTASASTIANIGLNGTISLLDLGSGDLIGRVDAAAIAPDVVTSGFTTKIALAGDRRTIVSATSDGGIGLWDVADDNLIAIACGTAGHDLAGADWRNLMGTEPPTDLPCRW